MPGVSPATDAEIVVVTALVTAKGVPSIAVKVSKVGVVENTKLFRLLLAPALIEEVNLTVLLVTKLCAAENICGITEFTRPYTVFPKVRPDSFDASNLT